MKWFCRLCWREGELFCGPDDYLAEGQSAHLKEVSLDMKAAKIPAGLNASMRDSAIMMKFPATYCAGDIQVSDAPPKRKVRFDKGTLPILDLGEEGIRV